MAIVCYIGTMGSGMKLFSKNNLFNPQADRLRRSTARSAARTERTAKLCRPLGNTIRILLSKQ